MTAVARRFGDVFGFDANPAPRIEFLVKTADHCWRVKLISLEFAMGLQIQRNARLSTMEDGWHKK